MRIITYTWLEKQYQLDNTLSDEEKRMVQDYLRRKHKMKEKGFDSFIDLAKAQKMAVSLDAIGVQL